MKRLLVTALAAVILLGVAARFLDAGFVRPLIERALERGLGRRVEVSGAHFNLLTGPGFTLDAVTIHEDPRAGVEPLAYVETLQARVRVLSLFFRRLEFSSLRLDDASINLVKTSAGPWNFQLLLNGTSVTAGAMPAIKMRGGRVNFKFGDTKSVLYFNDADLDVTPSTDGSLDLRFSGAPSRTDQSAQILGHFFVRGTWTGGRLDMKVELERSPLDEVARLMDQRTFGIHGVVALDAQLSGPPSHLDVAGQIQVDDVHRWDLLPKRGGGWRIGYTGTLDLHGERLELESTAEAPNPLALQFRAWDFLSRPHWEAAAALNQVPLATLVEVARHMGVAVRDRLAAEGSVSGTVRYTEPQGLSGQVELQDATLTLPEAKAVRAASAAVTLSGEGLTLEPTTVRIGESESAELGADYTLAAGAGQPAGLDLKITTRGLNIADLRSFGVAAIPLLDQTPQGTWRGSARFRWTPGASGEARGGWSGEYELQNARIAVDGLADPVRIQSALVSLSGARLVVTRLRGKAGAVAFTGEYRWDPAALRPHKFAIAIPEADAAELERLFRPTLMRERGFLARTLRLAASPPPDWLKGRRAEGTVSIGQLAIKDSRLKLDSARVIWDGTQVRLLDIKGELDQAGLAGEITTDLSGRSPRYRAAGKLLDLSYSGGKVDFEGSLEAEGPGAGLLASAQAEGRFRGRAIAFTPEADFRSVSGCFEMSPGSPLPRWKLSEVELMQGSDTYYGTGITQSDGHLVLDLENHGRQLRYTGPLVAFAP